MQKITPFLWFDGQAEEAMHHYVSIFKDSKVLGVTRYSDAGPAPAGSVMTANFVLNGQEFVALNGGPIYQFTPAISFVISCKTQSEIDHYWDALLEGGKAQQCGWLTDKFGVTWQVVPENIGSLLSDPDPAKASRKAMAMFQMIKLDIQGLLDA